MSTLHSIIFYFLFFFIIIRKDYAKKGLMQSMATKQYHLLFNPLMHSVPNMAHLTKILILI